MIYISTSMLDEDNLKEIYNFTGNNVGIELFPIWSEPFYEWTIIKEKNILKRIPTAFHGPYYGVEHSAPKGSSLYEYSMLQMIKTLKIAEETHSKYLVFHHNNKAVDDKKTMIKNSRKNLQEVNELGKHYNINIVVENAGAKNIGNMLLDEEEFINECKSIPNQVLLDIGHANCNGWNLEHVIKELADKIVAYHLHNNDGIHDLHKRINCGTLDFEAFLALVSKYTPDADLTIEYARTEAEDKKGILKDIKRLQEFKKVKETVLA